MSTRTRSTSLPHFLEAGIFLGLVATAACSGNTTTPSGTGGTNTSGGVLSAGGHSSTGGASAAGGVAATGGISATGGTKDTGGVITTGGAASGGVPATGGTKSTGGVPATGGTKNTGGVITTGGATSGGVLSTGGQSSTGGTTSVDAGTSTCGTGTASTGDVTVNLSSLLQKMSGFGSSTAWGSTFSGTNDADLLWSTTTGAGLSLHRIRISPNVDTSETNIAKEAIKRGATIWATPWTPPAVDKDNNNTVMGHLSNGQSFAGKLVNFVKTMKTAGVPIYAVSAQNEPDANVTYESCVYTGTTIASFIADYMGPAFADSGLGVKLMAPETQNWCGFKTFYPLITANTKAWGYIDIVATHEYGCSPSAYPDIAKAGKEFWETEIYDTNTNTDNGMGSALRVAKLIHEALTIANMNAWHYWWVYGGQNGGLFNNATKPATPTKRLWVMGNYSRFVRPGFVRVATTGTVPSGVLLTAYKNPADATVAIVAINNNTSATNVSLYVPGAVPCSMIPYVTDASSELAAKPAVTVTGARLTYSLPAQSVTTFVGKP